jgi:hypothetical protein
MAMEGVTGAAAGITEPRGPARALPCTLMVVPLEAKRPGIREATADTTAGITEVAVIGDRRSNMHRTTTKDNPTAINSNIPPIPLSRP